MLFHVIYTQSEMLLSKKQYGSWHEIQDEFSDYKASLGPWPKEDILDLFNDDYPDLDPPGQTQIEALQQSKQETVPLTFKEPVVAS